MAQHRQVGLCGAGGGRRLLRRRLAVGRHRAVVHLQEHELMTSLSSHHRLSTPTYYQHQHQRCKTSFSFHNGSQHWPGDVSSVFTTAMDMQSWRQSWVAGGSCEKLASPAAHGRVRHTGGPLPAGPPSQGGSGAPADSTPLAGEPCSVRLTQTLKSSSTDAAAYVPSQPRLVERHHSPGAHMHGTMSESGLLSVKSRRGSDDRR